MRSTSWSAALHLVVAFLALNGGCLVIHDTAELDVPATEGEGETAGEGEGEGEGEAVVGEGEGEGEAVVGEGEGEAVVGEGEGEGEAVVGEGEGEGEFVNGTIDAAVVVGHTLPTGLNCFQSVAVTVTMRNTGDTVWNEAGNYHLGAVDDTDPFFSNGNRLYLDRNVYPGEDYTFSLLLRAGGASTSLTDWRMVHDGVQWFGETAVSEVDVSCDASGSFYPCVIDGRFDMPAHEQRIAARNASLLRTGHVVTGDDNVDNAVLGGGSPDGGIWLSGQYHFEVGADGQVTSASWITVFSNEHFPVTGGIYQNGEIHMGSPVGVDISGAIANGVVSGQVAEAGMSVTMGDGVWNGLSSNDRSNLDGIWFGNSVEYVHGVMSGSWSAR
jgi:hypothetical protein